MNRSLWRGAFYGIAAASIWGGMYVVSDQVLNVIPPFTLLSIRLIMGVLVLGTLLLIQGQLRIPFRAAGPLLLVGVLGSGLSLGAQFVGTALSNGMNGAVITSASPAFIVLFAWLLLKEPLTPVRIAAVVLASIGTLIVLDLSKLDLSSATLQGNLALVFAALTWGAYSVLVRRFSDRFSSLVITFYALLGGLFIALPMGARELATQPIQLSQINANVILGVLYLGLISTSVALLWWNRAFALVEANVASLFFFAQPLVGVLLSVLLGQPFTTEIALGGGLIILGVLLSLQPSRQQKTSVAAE